MAVSIGAIVHGSSGASYTLCKEIGSGGEGTVYQLNNPALVAKIYKKIKGNIEKKIVYMVNHPLNDLYNRDGEPVMKLVWPRDVLYDDKGNFIGYIMPYVERGVEIFNVARGCDSPKSKAMFPKYTRLYNAVIALNLASAIAYLHQNNCLVGDMNYKNIMVGSKCLIILLDNDSFDITDPATNTHFKCETATQEYLAPELQGKDLHLESSRFTKESDCFSLAIHIFQLLMNNFHPFTGKQTTVTQNSSGNQQLLNIQTGRCPFVRNFSDFTIPVTAPILNEMVTPKLAEDFKKTFTYDQSNVMTQLLHRTSAKEWQQDLLNYVNILGQDSERAVCSNDPTHIYVKSIGKCGLCAAKQRCQSYMNSKGIVSVPVHTVNAVPSSPPVQAPPVSASPATTNTSGVSGLSKSPNTPSSHTPPKSKNHFLAIAAVCLIIAVIFAAYQNSSPRYSQDYDSKDSHLYNNTAESDDAQEPKNWFDGDWLDAPEGDELEGLRVFVLDEPIIGCKSLTIFYSVEVTDGTSCTDWSVYARTGLSWEEIGSMYFSNGQGDVTKTFYPDNNMDIYAISILPNDSTNISWNQSILVYEVEESGFSETQSASEYELASGYWSSEKYQITNDFNGYAWMLDPYIPNCTNLKIEFDVEMHSNSYCEDWDLYAWDGEQGKWVRLGYLYLPNGDGSTEKTVCLEHPINMVSIAVVPRKTGSYSWTQSISVYTKS